MLQKYSYTIAPFLGSELIRSSDGLVSICFSALSNVEKKTGKTRRNNVEEQPR